ncbi:shikimate kinase [Lactobacillus nasalidis]|uniref:Shikimate kinase n=1 Tax=Lactobacillus nasalidis TaxID=2797258 RepID=A0ABQ3WAA5_9LACO|nr:shikimate kinase [Lactobacillus nasalidis]GHV98196.1 shikimate kinase [Lactobacillus nasalidis]GHV98626.1 shikimate kinase [Lactobacillus nasalidis]GHW02019.1 shikimate kinase [Lactobacillus nasalidis]
MRIVLVGFMACGKTTIGQLLAARLKQRQIDLDEEIVAREGLAIPEIFSRFGEEHFRLSEHQALLDNIGQDAVITTGGGTPMRDDNAACLINSGAPVILLDAEISTIVDRIGNDRNRPIANKLDPAGLEKLKASRQSRYERVASLKIQTDQLRPEEICDQILDFCREWNDSEGQLLTASR